MKVLYYRKNEDHYNVILNSDGIEKEIFESESQSKSEFWIKAINDGLDYNLTEIEKVLGEDGKLDVQLLMELVLNKKKNSIHIHSKRNDYSWVGDNLFKEIQRQAFIW